MTSLPRPGDAATVTSSEDVRWYRIAHESAVGALRRGAVELAERLGFGESKAGEVGIVATELASNQVKHAGGGSVLLRVCRTRDDAGVELVAVDEGPGMADVSASVADGRSTTGTLGIGLGAISRLSTSWDVFSAPGRGTVIAVSVGPGGVTTAPGPVAVAGLSRPMTGEDICGDAYAVRVDDGAVTVLLADGLGHGPLAARAATVAVRAFREAPPGGALALLTVVHRALAGTRGAAVAVLRYDGGDEVRYAGIGNIGGHVIDTTHPAGGHAAAARRRGLMSYPGIAGAQARTVRELTYDFPADAAVVLHSDGLTDRLDLTPAVLDRSPTVIAAVALRDFGVRNDDASVLVLRRSGSR